MLLGGFGFGLWWLLILGLVVDCCGVFVLGLGGLRFGFLWVAFGMVGCVSFGFWGGVLGLGLWLGLVWFGVLFWIVVCVLILFVGFTCVCWWVGLL